MSEPESPDVGQVGEQTGPSEAGGSLREDIWMGVIGVLFLAVSVQAFLVYGHLPGFGHGFLVMLMLAAALATFWRAATNVRDRRTASRGGGAKDE
jgi:hypothetical protein